MNSSRSTTVRSIWLPSTLLGLFMLVTAPANFFLPVFFSDTLHFSATQIGLLFALQASTGIVAALPTGVGNDRLSSRVIIALSLVGIAAGYVLMATVTTFWLYAWVFVVGNLAVNVLRLSMDVQVLKLDDGTRTGARMAVYHGLRFGGLLVGTAISGYALQRFSFAWCLVGVAVLCLAMITATPLLAPTPLARASVAQYKQEFVTPRVLIFSAWVFLFTLHWGAEYTCYGLFLHKELQLPLIDMGWYMSAEFGVMLVTVVLAGRFAKSGPVLTAFMAVGLAASGLGQIGMVLKPTGLSLAFRCLHGVGDALYFLVLYVGIVRLFAAQHLGGNTGLITFVQMAGTVLGALTSSWIGGHFGYGVPLWVTGILNVILVIPVLITPSIWNARPAQPGQPAFEHPADAAPTVP